MTLFIMGCLGAFLIAFLIMISIQLIRSEKSLTDIVEISEARVKQFYESGGSQLK